MRNISRQAVGAAVGALAITVVGIGPSAAADLSLNEGQYEAPPAQYHERQTYSEQSRVDEYVEREAPPVYEVPPPVVYAPPPVVYGPPVVVAPPPYFVRPYGYRVPAYVVARRGPYVIRRPWRHPRRW